MKAVKTRKGNTWFIPSMSEIESADEDLGGFCRSCGEETGNVEPDAREYICESCGQPTVFGAAEFAIRGWVYMGDNDDD